MDSIRDSKREGELLRLYATQEVEEKEEKKNKQKNKCRKLVQEMR